MMSWQEVSFGAAVKANCCPTPPGGRRLQCECLFVRLPSGICLPEKRKARKSDPLTVPQTPPRLVVLAPGIERQSRSLRLRAQVRRLLWARTRRTMAIFGGSICHDEKLIHPQNHHHLAARSTFARKLDRSWSRRAFAGQALFVKLAVIDNQNLPTLVAVTQRQDSNIAPIRRRLLTHGRQATEDMFPVARLSLLKGLTTSSTSSHGTVLPKQE